MLGIDRHAARVVWTAALVLLSLVLVYLARKTLFVFTLALLLAYLLAPLVNLLDRLLPGRWPRTWALAASYVIFVGTLILVGSAIGTQVVEQANTLARTAPALLAKWEAPPGGPEPPSFQRQAITQFRNELTRRSSNIMAELPKAGLRVLSLASNLIDIIIVPLLAFFFLKDGYQIREHLLALATSESNRALWDDVFTDVNLLLIKYMRAIVMLVLTAFVAYWVSLSLIQVRYALLLATVGALLEVIPMLGPLTAGIVITLVAAISGSSVGAVVAALIGFRMLQDYVISPQLMGHGLELHPLLILFGVFAGAEIAGIPGTFVSVPVIAAFRIVVVRARRARAATISPVTVP